MNKYLYHWGIKGQKKGVRRYQYEDGSLTPAGKERYARDVAENKAKKKDNRIQIDGPDPNRWVKEDLRRTSDVVDKVSKIEKATESAYKSATSKKSRPRMDLSSMSDQELRDAVNRYNLEKQYVSAFSEPTVSKGEKFMNTFFEVGGTALSVATSAIGLALAIKELKG